MLLDSPPPLDVRLLLACLLNWLLSLWSSRESSPRTKTSGSGEIWLPMDSYPMLELIAKLPCTPEITSLPSNGLSETLGPPALKLNLWELWFQVKLPEERLWWKLLPSSTKVWPDLLTPAILKLWEPSWTPKPCPRSTYKHTQYLLDGWKGRGEERLRFPPFFLSGRELI